MLRYLVLILLLKIPLVISFTNPDIKDGEELKYILDINGVIQYSKQKLTKFKIENNSVYKLNVEEELGAKMEYISLAENLMPLEVKRWDDRGIIYSTTYAKDKIKVQVPKDRLEDAIYFIPKGFKEYSKGANPPLILSFFEKIAKSY
jgi:hypothetical protein